MIIYKVYSEAASRVQNSVIYLLDNHIFGTMNILGSDDIKRTLDILHGELTAIEDTIKQNISEMFCLTIRKESLNTGMKLSKEERILLSEVQELDPVNVDLPELYLDFLNTLQERINTNDIAANEISAMMQVHQVVKNLLDQYQV